MCKRESNPQKEFEFNYQIWFRKYVFLIEYAKIPAAVFEPHILYIQKRKPLQRLPFLIDNINKN